MDIPGYKVVRELGRGGMATVYLAVQETLSRQVALKVINPELAADDGFRERFVREGQIVARFRHSQIVIIYDFRRHGTSLLLSMEYLPGGTLKERIKRGLAKPQVLEIVSSMARALAYAHRNGVVHRDVKPANILFREDDTPVLTDFGIARFLDDSTRLTQPGLSMGSPRYMSPEQVMGHAIDFRSDIYSLGIVFYEMLTGNVPWSDTSNPVAAALMHCTAPIPSLPAELIEYQPILEKLLAKKPEDRYQDADDFTEDLRRVRRNEMEREGPPEFTEILPSPPLMPKPGRRAAGRKPVILTVALLVTAGLGIGGYWLLSGRPDDSQLFDESRRQLLDTLNRTPQDEDAWLQAVKDFLEKQRTHKRARQLLVRAQQELEAGRLDKASSLVKDGLDLAPGDKDLASLKTEIDNRIELRKKIAKLVTLAAEKADAGGPEEALAAVVQALQLDPGNQQALDLRAQLEAKIKSRQEAANLLAEAQERREAGDFEKSLTLINAGLDLIPGHPPLLSARTQVQQALSAEKLHKANVQRADALLLQARKALDLANLEEAHRLAEQGLKLVPDYPALASLLQEVKERQASAARNPEEAARLLGLAAQKRTKGRLEEALAQCKVHFRANRLTSGDSRDPGTAYDCYREVLELDPENTEALEGITQIAGKYAGWTSGKIDQRNSSAAHRYLDRLVDVDPQYPQLAELRERLEQLDRSLASSRHTAQPTQQTRRRTTPPPKDVPTPAPSVAEKEEKTPTEPPPPHSKAPKPFTGTF
jgi:serine/threonine-protein kinase PpkA